MPGTFFGLEIGRRGLAAAQIGQDVTGQNVANAGTVGYSVQSVTQVASDPYTTADKNTILTPGLIGTGVSVTGIQRARDQFLDAQVRVANSNLQSQTSQSNTLQQVNNTFGEPSDTGLNAALTSFFNSFHDVASDPGNLGVRAATVQAGAALTSVFHTTQAGLTAIASSISGQITTDVQSVNSYSTQIAALNVEIRKDTVGGQSPNDLLDQRDVLLDKLSGLANISTLNNSDGTINVSVGSVGLVLGTDSFPTTLSALNANGDLTNGTLSGLTQAQTVVAGYQTQLDTLAASVASQVNTAQTGGLDLNGNAGTPFFTVTPGSEGTTIAVNPDLQTNPDHLAAASTPIAPATFGAGDGSNAQAIAGLLTQTVTSVGDPLVGKTIQSYYQLTVSDAGSRAASAKTADGVAKVSYTQLSNQRDSVTGVSTDTEMINMMKYQRAYQASARVVTMMDDMIGTLITGLFSGN